MVPQQRLVDERTHDRRRIREAGRLHHDPSERRHLARVTTVEERPKLVGEIAAQRAAQATRREQHRALVDPADDVVVDPDLPQLVHDHRRLTQRRMREEL